jgi:hypothetical protein
MITATSHFTRCKSLHGCKGRAPCTLTSFAEKLAMSQVSSVIRSIAQRMSTKNRRPAGGPGRFWASWPLPGLSGGRRSRLDGWLRFFGLPSPGCDPAGRLPLHTGFRTTPPPLEWRYRAPKACPGEDAPLGIPGGGAAHAAGLPPETQNSVKNIKNGCFF